MHIISRSGRVDNPFDHSVIWKPETGLQTMLSDKVYGVINQRHTLMGIANAISTQYMSKNLNKERYIQSPVKHLRVSIIWTFLIKDYKILFKI